MTNHFSQENLLKANNLKFINSKIVSGFAWTILSTYGKGILREDRKVVP